MLGPPGMESLRGGVQTSRGLRERAIGEARTDLASAGPQVFTILHRVFVRMHGGGGGGGGGLLPAGDWDRQPAIEGTRGLLKFCLLWGVSRLHDPMPRIQWAQLIYRYSHETPCPLRFRWLTGTPGFVGRRLAPRPHTLPPAASHTPPPTRPPRSDAHTPLSPPQAPSIAGTRPCLPSCYG